MILQCLYKMGMHNFLVICLCIADGGPLEEILHVILTLTLTTFLLEQLSL